MRWFARAALAALGSVATVFIACAYGVPWRYVKGGRVVDAGTGEGIPGVRVACLQGGGVGPSVLSGGGGAFQLHLDEPCSALAFDDVDGAEGGAYASESRPFTEGDELDLLVALEPLP